MKFGGKAHTPNRQTISITFSHVRLHFLALSVHNPSFRARYQILLTPLRQRIAQRPAADVLPVLLPIQVTQVIDTELVCQQVKQVRRTHVLGPYRPTTQTAPAVILLVRIRLRKFLTEEVQEVV